MTQPDSIHISNLTLITHIGVPDGERAAPQRLSISLTLQPARSFADLRDRIEETINYTEVCAVVRALAAARPRRLIETLADDIAAEVLAEFPACEVVEVELRKFILPDTDYVAVRLTRRRATSP